MNVLLVTESYWPNADGGALFERRLALGLIGHGHHVTIWAPGTRATSYEEVDGPSRIHREKSVRFIVNPKYRVSYFPFWHARRLIKSQHPDLIHIHNFGLMGVSALFWARRYHTPIVGTNHFMPENALLNLKFLRPFSTPLSSLIWWYLVTLHNRCNIVTTPTKTAVGLLIDHGLKAPVEHITNGIDTNIFHPGQPTATVQKKYHLPTGKPLLLYLGRVDGEKRLDVIITALAKINPSAHLVIAGAGVAEHSLKNQAAHLKLTSRVTFTGYIDEADKPALYNAATAFVIASPAELQSIVLLEAMASSLPVIAVNVAALSELCHDGQNGYLFPRDNASALADAANRLLADPELAHRFGQASRRIIEESHSTGYTFDRYEACYRAALTPAALKPPKPESPTAPRSA